MGDNDVIININGVLNYPFPPSSPLLYDQIADLLSFQSKSEDEPSDTDVSIQMSTSVTTYVGNQ